MTPFLMVPGLNADARIFRDATEALWPFGPVTIASTLAGEGVAGMAAAILETAPPSFAVGGFSMGGYIAFEMLRQASHRVLKLALIDTTARADTPETIELRRRRIEQAQAGKFGLVVDQSFATSVHPQHVGDESLRAIHRGMALANGPEAYVRHVQAIIDRPDSRAMLSTIGVPTAVIVGEADQTTPVAVAQEMHQAIQASQLVVIAGAGHLALIERPAEVAAALLDWARA